MKLRIEAAMAGAPSEEVRRQLEAADTEVDRLAGIVNRLLVMARRIEEGGPSEIDLDDVVQRALERWGERASRQGAALTARGEGGRALGEPADLDQIVDNLIDNAVAYAPGPVVIETGRADGRAFLAVEDVGPGIAADERPGSPIGSSGGGPRPRVGPASAWPSSGTWRRSGAARWSWSRPTAAEPGSRFAS